MRAIILAAGRGSRMGALTDDRPKCLLPFRGRALLDWQLDALAEAGIDEVALVTGYRHELLAGRTQAEFHNPRWAETNMVRSLQTAQAWLETGPCLVCYADLFYTTVGPHALARLKVPLAITYDPDWLPFWSRRFADPLSDAETFRIGDDGTLLEIGDRPARVEDVQGQYMGLLRIEPCGWAELTRQIATTAAAEVDRLQMTHLLQKTILAGVMRVSTTPYRDDWAEYDSAADIIA